MAEKTNTPEIRFAGFTDPWEQRKVGEFLTVSKIPGHTGVDAKKLTVKLWGKGVVEKTDLYGGSENTQYYVRRAGQFMYGKLDFLHAAFGIVPENLDKYESTLDSPAFDLNGIDGQFLLNKVTQEDFYLRHGLVANGSRKAKRIHEDTFMAMPILVPSIEEQRQIGECFIAIDNLITLHQRKYDRLKNVKKSMLEKMFPRDGSNIPEIRFAGFTDPWEQCKLKDAFDFLQNNTLSRADLSLESGAAKNVHYGDVLIKFGEYTDASKTALPYIPSQQIVDKYKGSILKDGDIIIADTAEDETVGKCTEIANLQGFPTISGLHTIPLRPRDKFATGFLGYYMNSGAYHDQLLPLMQGIKVTSISKGALQDTVISYPSDSAEQAAIGQYFINLDNLITLHQRKYEKLQQIKKSMLEKMFV